MSANYKRSSKPRKVLENYTITQAFCARLGVIRVDLLTNESENVDPGAHSTLSGIDGLYWNKGEFLGVQYGTGVYRVMRWQLSPMAA